MSPCFFPLLLDFPLPILLVKKRDVFCTVQTLVLRRCSLFCLSANLLLLTVICKRPTQPYLALWNAQNYQETIQNRLHSACGFGTEVFYDYATLGVDPCALACSIITVQVFGVFISEWIRSVQEGSGNYWKTKPESNRKALGKTFGWWGGEGEGEWWTSDWVVDVGDTLRVSSQATAKTDSAARRSLIG